MLVLLTIIVFGPIVSERLRIPGIVGLIAGGMIFGPFAIGWLEADGLVTELGAIGILYLMFLAGLSFDIQAFRDNRQSATVTPDPAVAAAVLGEEEIEQDDVEILIAPADSGSIIDRLDHNDIVIAPAHVLHDLAPRAGWRIAKILEHSNVVIVGGPHRLSISGA